jgi:hypothetical protein
MENARQGPLALRGPILAPGKALSATALDAQTFGNFDLTLPRDVVD